MRHSKAWRALRPHNWAEGSWDASDKFTGVSVSHQNSIGSPSWIPSKIDRVTKNKFKPSAAPVLKKLWLEMSPSEVFSR